MPIIDGINIPGELADLAMAPPEAIRNLAGNFPRIPMPAPRIWGAVPQPIEAVVEYSNYEFQGFNLRIPDWAEYITQSHDGTIQVFSGLPLAFKGVYATRNAKQKMEVLVRPENYEAIMEQI